MILGEPNVTLKNCRPELFQFYLDNMADEMKIAPIKLEQVCYLYITMYSDIFRHILPYSVTFYRIPLYSIIFRRIQCKGYHMS
jgi:hypothetical protein